MTTMERATRELTFEQEADLYEKEAYAEITKEKSDGEPSAVCALLQMGRRVVHRARQELADRVEVVQGRWLEGKKKHFFSDKGNYICSNCQTATGIVKFNYCPNCGAKMKKEI